MRRVILPAVFLALLQACSGREAVLRPVNVPRIEVIHCRLAPSKEIVDVQFRVYGTGKVAPDPAGTYLLDEGTGEKYYLMVLQRIGRLAEIRNPEETAVHSIMFRNPYGILRIGAKVTLVVGELRQEHVVVEK
ncbi:MAG: hypothetical protein M0Z38_09105 [Deltaproteobacteria bacterium]|nr:hypothetical protein [Deltaproteobacteria bacterium]